MSKIQTIKKVKSNFNIMPAYIIVDIKTTDSEKYEEYKKLTPSSITAFDGKFIVRGGKIEDLI